MLQIAAESAIGCGRHAAFYDRTTANVLNESLERNCAWFGSQRRSEAWSARTASFPDCASPRIPYNSAHLVASGAGVTKEFGPFRLDALNQCLWRRDGSGEDERILLTPTEFGVLHYLVEHPGRLITHGELLDAVWPRTAIEPQVVKSKIFHLRQRLGDDSKQPRFIETVQRRGYRFVASIASPAIDEANGRTARRLVVGREQTLNELWNGFHDARNGNVQVVFLGGEPGIGKTAVAEEFCRQVATGDRVACITRGQCVEGFGSKEPFYPVLDAVGELCQRIDGARVVETLASRAPTWLVQFPALLTERHRQTLQQEILGATRERMLREIVSALEDIAKATPLLILLEDLHWADPSTLDLISALARHRAPARILLVATYRSTDLTRSTQPLHALKRDLVARQFCRDIALAPLSEADIAEYVAARGAASDHARELASLLHRTTEGNPLFVIAVLEQLLERGVVEPDRGWRLRLSPTEISVDVPETLRQMISALIERLSDGEQHVLEVASIAGMSFAPVLCAPTADMDGLVFETCCDTLARRGQVLRRDDTRELPNGMIVQRYGFVHALYREVLYQRQAPAARAMRHRRRAEQLRQAFEPALDEVTAELAHHFEKGADWPHAVQYRRRAAELAVRRYALDEARANLEHALDLAGRLSPATRAAAETEILDSLSEMDVVTFDRRAVETLSRFREHAARHGLIEAEAKALVNLVLPLAWTDGRSALGVIEEALRLSERTLDPLARARIRAACLQRRIGVAGWSSDDARQCADALDVIRQLGTPTDVAWHTIDCSWVDFYRSDYRTAHENVVASSAALMKEDDPDTYLHFAVAHWNCDLLVPWSLNLLGEWGDAVRDLQTRMEWAERNGDSHRRVLLQLSGMWMQLNAMDFRCARDTGVSLLPGLPRHVEDTARRMCLIITGAAEVGLGNYEAALELLLTARDEMDSQPVIADWHRRLMLEWALTNLWLGRGDVARANEEGKCLIEHVNSSTEATWRGLVWETNARVALASQNLRQALESSEKATDAVQRVEAPVAAWQVYATAAEVARARGDLLVANRHQQMSREIVRKLAASLDRHTELQHKFLTAPAVRRALGEHANAPRCAAESFNNQIETAR